MKTALSWSLANSALNRSNFFCFSQVSSGSKSARVDGTPGSISNMKHGTPATRAASYSSQVMDFSAPAACPSGSQPYRCATMPRNSSHSAARFRHTSTVGRSSAVNRSMRTGTIRPTRSIASSTTFRRATLSRYVLEMKTR